MTRTTLLVLLFPVMLAAQVSAPLELSLKQAIEMALAPDGNARVKIAQEAVRQAQFRSAQARAALLPNIDGSVAEQNQTRNLAAFGIKISVPLMGFTMPEKAGPYNTFDARASLTQSVLDLSAIRRYQAARVGLQAAGDEGEAARDQVARLAATQYLAALRAAAKVESAQADLRLSESLVQLASNQKDAGTGTAIEVTRAKVQQSQARQQLLLAQNDARQAHLELQRTIGLPMETPVRLTGTLDFQPVAETSPEQALQAALSARADWKAQQKREQAAKLSYSGAKLERLPVVSGFADYGAIGTGITNAFPTRTYGVGMRVPLFDGGRRDARRGESLSQYEQERARTADLRRQIELDVRLSLDDLQSAREQVAVAGEGLSQVEAELEQAQRRYRAGVAGSLEVTDAQTRLARARDNRIAALFLYNRARLDLLAAMGAIRRVAE